MTLKEFVELHDDGNRTLWINDKNLKKVWSGKIVDFQKCKWKPIINAEVMAFGFYDDELTVRINVEKF